jgi:non-reducing end alpha-L-arabinofuranosidase
MRTRNFWNEISLVAILVMCGWGCTVTSAMPTGSGGTTGAGGDTSGGTFSGCLTGSAGATGAAASAGPTTLPCDVYAADGGPCVAAHSTVRALYAAYSGPLYQVRKGDGTTMDIAALTAGGLANSADQDAFCGTEACTISIIYDQSPQANHLTRAPPSMVKPTQTNESNAKALPVMLGANKVYGVRITPGGGYRNNAATGTAEGDNPETEYMVVAGDFHNGGCCFDYGNMERNSRNNGEGTMEAVYFGTCTIWGKGAANGPWVMGDLENGLWAGNVSPYQDSKPVSFKYVTAMVKGDVAGSNHWTIKLGNAECGSLVTPFDGQRPSTRYNPMRKEGAIGLGTGGDGSSGAQGNFFEGVMTAHYSSNAADDAVQANIVSVYGPQ